MSGGVIRITMLAFHVAGHVLGDHITISPLSSCLVHIEHPIGWVFYMSDDDDDDEPVLVTVL